MASEQPDTVIVDPSSQDDDPSLARAPVLRAREWYESPLLWVGVVVVLLLSIPMLLELSSSSRRQAAAAGKASAPTDLLPLPPAPQAPVSAAPQPSIGGTAPGAPPRATPALTAPRQTEADPRQVVIKCMEPGGRIVYTQTGACTGNMVPVPIDTETNLVDSPVPKRAGPAPSPVAPAASR